MTERDDNALFASTTPAPSSIFVSDARRRGRGVPGQKTRPRQHQRALIDIAVIEKRIDVRDRSAPLSAPDAAALRKRLAEIGAEAVRTAPDKKRAT